MPVAGPCARDLGWKALESETQVAGPVWRPPPLLQPGTPPSCREDLGAAWEPRTRDKKAWI